MLGHFDQDWEFFAADPKVFFFNIGLDSRRTLSKLLTRPFLTAFFASHASLDLPSLCGSQVGCKIPAGGKMKTYDGKYPTCRRNWSLTVTSSACPEGNQDLNWPVVSRVNFTPSAAELNANWRTASLTKPCQTTAVPNDAHSLSESCTHFVIALIC